MSACVCVSLFDLLPTYCLTFTEVYPKMRTKAKQ